MEALTLERGVLEVQFGSQLVPLVHAHLLSGMSELQNASISSYAICQLVHLVEGETLERGNLEVQFGSQHVPLVHAHLLSGLSELHNASYSRHALYQQGTPCGSINSGTRCPRGPIRISAFRPGPFAFFE